MTHSVAKERPSISAALELFHSLVEKVDRSHLRARCRRKPLFKGDRELLPVEAYNAMRHTYKKMVYTYKGFPPVPQRNPPKDKKPTVIEQITRPFGSLNPRRLLPSTPKSEPTTNVARNQAISDSTANPEPATESERLAPTADTANPGPIANATEPEPSTGTSPEPTTVTTSKQVPSPVNCPSLSYGSRKLRFYVGSHSPLRLRSVQIKLVPCVPYPSPANVPTLRMIPYTNTFPDVNLPEVVSPSTTHLLKYSPCVSKTFFRPIFHLVQSRFKD